MSAQLFSIDQSVDAMLVESILVKASAITFAVPSVHGTYKGTLSTDGLSIQGIWTQGGSSHPLDFIRPTKSSAWALDQSPHKASFITVALGVKLEVLDWGGTGRPLVLLAGLGNSAHSFDRFAPKLTNKYRVLAITRRGYDASDAPTPNGANYSADRLGDDVISVLDQLKLAHPVLIGHSIAGEELSSIGSRYPERVAGLVYLDAAYSYAFYNAARPEFQMDLLTLRRELNAVDDTIAPQQQRKLLTEITKALPQFEKDLDTRQKELASRPDMSAVEITQAKVQMESKQSISGRAVFSGMQPYTHITCPMLAIFALPHQRGTQPDPAGDAKDIAEIEPQVQAFQAAMPQARVVKIAHADHYVFASNEAEVIHLIEDFVAGLN